jgi:hypothetical protein
MVMDITQLEKAIRINEKIDILDKELSQYKSFAEKILNEPKTTNFILGIYIEPQVIEPKEPFIPTRIEVSNVAELSKFLNEKYALPNPNNFIEKDLSNIGILKLVDSLIESSIDQRKKLIKQLIKLGVNGKN